MPLIGSIIVPHPPLILPEVGRGEEWKIQRTIDAYRAAAKRVVDWKPEVLVLTTPHLVTYADYFHISPGDGAEGDMSSFHAPRTRLGVWYDGELRGKIIRRAETAGIPAGTLGVRGAKLDWGTLIPLYFLREAGLDVNIPIVRIGLSGLTPATHYRLGQCVAEAVNALGRRAAFIASGDLSHKLSSKGPYGFAPEGPEFDRQAEEIMASGAFGKFLTMDAALCEKAAECGLRSFQIMTGALDGLAVRPELLSHEGPLGVGYAVAVYTVTGRDETRRFGAEYEAAQRTRMEERRRNEDAYVRLARLSLETYVRTKKRLDRLPEGLPEEMTGGRAGAFVSLHKDGQLRGCIGTTGPTRPTLAWEIAQNAVSAGTGDPRFIPVTADELEALEYSVDVLSAPEKIDSPAQLDVKRYGVIVSHGLRHGLLLPDLDGVDTVEQQIDIARQKAGINSFEPYTLERFEVVRHG